jgi:cell division topological specificity factor
MSGWLDRFLGQKTRSASQAKDRLKLVLIHDRTDLSPDILEKMKNEMLQVISRYVEIDPGAVRIQMAHEGREQRLVADIPLRVRARKS